MTRATFYMSVCASKIVIFSNYRTNVFVRELERSKIVKATGVKIEAFLIQLQSALSLQIVSLIVFSLLGLSRVCISAEKKIGETEVSCLVTSDIC